MENVQDCTHFWIVTAWYRAQDEVFGVAGLRASKVACPNCGLERALTAFGNIAEGKYQPSKPFRQEPE